MRAVSGILALQRRGDVATERRLELWQVELAVAVWVKDLLHVPEHSWSHPQVLALVNKQSHWKPALHLPPPPLRRGSHHEREGPTIGVDVKVILTPVYLVHFVWRITNEIYRVV